jgi:hypothetical protein
MNIEVSDLATVAIGLATVPMHFGIFGISVASLRMVMATVQM